MASIFPTNPNPGETFTVGTTTYQWTGSAWLKVNSVSTGSSTLGSLTVTTVLSVTSSVDSTSTTSGALQISGGIGIGKNIVIGTTATILGTAVSTSTTTGALIVIGGVGIGGSVNVGGNLTVSGSITGTITTATTLNNVGGVSSAGTYYVQFVSNNTTSSQTPNTTAALNFNPSTGELYATKFSGSGADLTNIPNNALDHSQITVNAGTGIYIVGSPVSLGGSVSVYNTGVLSFSGGSTGLTPSTATTGTVTLAGTLGTGYGGTNNTVLGNPGSIAYSDGTKYQFNTTGTTGFVLVSGGAGAPVFQNTLTLSSVIGTASTTTGALQVAGGVGIGGGLYIGGTITGTNEVLSGTLSVTSYSTLGLLTATTFTATSANILGNVTISGYTQATLLTATIFTATSSNIFGNESVGGNLSVTGYSTLGLLTATVFTATSSNILGNESVGGNLTVTGYSTLGLLTATVFTATSANIIGNETVSGTLTVNSESFLKGVTATIITATSLVIVGTTTATSTTTGVITVAGGIGAYNAYLSQLNVNNYASFAGPVTFGNDVTFSGTATYVLSTNTYYTDNLLELHVPPAGVYTPWTYPDGKDIGFRFHYYDRTLSTDSNAALVLANDSQILKWYGSGAEVSTGTFIGATYGTFKTGVIQLAGGNATNNASSGDLQVTGGVGIGGGLFVANSVTASILTLVGTTVASSTNTGALIVAGGVGIGGDIWAGNIFTGLGQYINFGGSTGTRIWRDAARNGLDLQSSGVSRLFIHDTDGVVSISSTATSTSTTTGALIVAGGAGVAGKLYVGGDINAVSNVVLNDTAVVHNATGISVGISTTTIDTFSTSTYRSAKYVVSVSNSSINQYQTSEILVVQNGSNSYLQSTSVFSSATFIMSFVTSVVGNNVVLQGTGIAAGNTVKVQKIYITI